MLLNCVSGLDGERETLKDKFMGVVTTILRVLLVIDCVSMIGLILLQKGRGGGLAGAFGGMGGETAFGTRAATLAQKVTAVLFGVFVLLTVGLGWLAQRQTAGGGFRREEPRETQPFERIPAEIPSPSSESSTE